jgi:hypothetical protein
MFYYVMVARLAFVIIFEVKLFSFKENYFKHSFHFSILCIVFSSLFEISLHVYQEMFELNLIDVDI